MRFSYEPWDMTVLVLSGTALVAIWWRWKKGGEISWTFLFWLLLLWINHSWEGPWHPYGLLAGAAMTALMRFEFHGGFMTSLFKLLETAGFAYVIYAGTRYALQY